LVGVLLAQVLRDTGVLQEVLEVGTRELQVEATSRTREEEKHGGQ
jgi:hypothetical protein